MLYLLTIEVWNPQQLDPTYQQTLVLLTLQPVLLRPLLRTIMKELEGLLIACKSEALDHTNSLQTHFPAHNWESVQLQRSEKDSLQADRSTLQVHQCPRGRKIWVRAGHLLQSCQPSRLRSYPSLEKQAVISFGLLSFIRKGELMLGCLLLQPGEAWFYSFGGKKPSFIKVFSKRKW